MMRRQFLRQFDIGPIEAVAQHHIPRLELVPKLVP